MAVLLYVTALAVALIAYLWKCDRDVSTTPTEAAKFVQKPWTKEELWETYKKLEKDPIDVRKFLPPKLGRRYIVTGGSGLSGGWIVQHLLMRGEDPKAIRILDLVPNSRPEIIAADVAFHKTDVSDPQAVTAAFEAPWPMSVKDRPLTVFHTVALINPSDRKKIFLDPLIRVNINGTKNCLDAAHKVGASCFIGTSSGSVGMRVPNYFPLPWQVGKNVIQVRDNAEPHDLDDPLEAYPICYTWTKARGEKLIREASTEACPTGIIRPTNGVYGTGLNQSSSLSWTYLNMGGGPTWLKEVVQPFVSSQNVSIGHLALEKALLEKKPGVAGSGYAISDPGPPILYRDLYHCMTLLAHPSTPVVFPTVPFLPLFLMSYLVEQYKILRHRYFSAWLPPVTGDLANLQPGVFNVCTVHMLFPHARAEKEIGYRGAYTTMEGMCDVMVDWNRKAAAKAAKAEGGMQVEEDTKVPVPPPAA